MASNEWKGLPRPELAAVRRPATKCHDGKCELSSTHSEGEVHGYFVRWDRSRQERFCDPRSRRARQGGAGAPECATRPAAAACGRVAAVRHRHGGVLGCASLGEAVRTTRPHGAADGAQVRLALSHERQARQERRGGRASDLRGHATAEHAVRSGQEPGRPMPRRSARRWVGRTCASCR